MIGSILQIIFGLFIWKIVPGWIEYGSVGTRNFIKLCCNIIGIIVLISAVITLLRSLSVALL